ncbi:hypothetical protein [Pantoea allii]
MNKIGSFFDFIFFLTHFTASVAEKVAYADGNNEQEFYACH